MASVSLIWILNLLFFGFVDLVEAVLLRHSAHHRAAPVESSVAALHLQQDVGSEDVAFDKYLEDWFDDFLARKPMESLRFGRPLKSCKGLSKGNGLQVPHIWGDPSAAAETQGIAQDEQWLHKMQERFGKSIGARDLADERHVSYILMQRKVEEMRQENLYRAFRPPFGPLGCQIGVMGCQVQAAGMLRGFGIDTVDDARCYVALSFGLKEFLQGHAQRLQEAADQGIMPYRFVLEGVTKDCNAKLPAEPQTPADERKSARLNEFFKAFEAKLGKASGISEGEKSSLLQEAETAIINGVWPAYHGLRSLVQGLLPKAITADKGLVALYGSKAQEFYDYRVQLLGVGGNARSLHERAVELVNENAADIKASASVVLNSSQSLVAAASPSLISHSLQEVYSRSHYDNTASGKSKYIQDVTADIDMMWHALRDSAKGGRLNRLFLQADITDLPCSVERLDSPSFPGLAQYSPGSIGKANRSASVAFNIHDMREISKLDMQTLAYHEVVPGHHLQVSKTLALPLPSFRRYFGDEAFAEGWAVYAEQDLSPRLVNFSASSNLGRLNLRQTKAVRMAVDTGLHFLGWDRKKAEAYYMEHTLVSQTRAAQSVDRHFAWPTQTLNYAAGYEGLKKLRQAVLADKKLVNALGNDWEAMMHSAILSHGDMPLAMLDQVVFAQLKSWAGTQDSM